MPSLTISHPSKCTGCNLCSFACSQKNSGCLSFAEAHIKVWPAKAGGFTIEVDSGRCTGCGHCVEACPRGCLELKN